ncbi:MAG TPA: hypothetical protein IAB20_03040 [Candidatus Pullichristensenella excrementipullorum]|nr:hypothetical protein [Candidatus Pullichristensenella excrementipullorum]
MERSQNSKSQDRPDTKHQRRFLFGDFHPCLFASCTVSNHPPKPIRETFRRRVKVILPEKTTQQAARHAAGLAVQDSDKHFARSGRHGDACRGDCRRVVESCGKFLRYMPQIRHILARFFQKFIVSHGR